MSNVSKVTLVLPTSLWEKVKQLVPPGQRSKMVSEALQAELRHRQRLEQVGQLRQLQDYLRGKYGELPGSVDELTAMREERDDAIT
jgi:metal-responsive CopG/Arc/MetJ family transcriptional regulator